MSRVPPPGARGPRVRRCSDGRRYFAAEGGRGNRWIFRGTPAACAGSEPVGVRPDTRQKPWPVTTAPTGLCSRPTRWRADTRPRERGPVRALGRRDLIRGACGMMAGAGLGMLTSACGSPAAAPAAASAKTRVVFSYFAPWAGFTVNSTTTPLIERLFQPFRDSHKGLDLVLQLTNPPAGIPQQIVEGTGPDVFWSNIMGPLVDHSYVRDLTPYLKADNIQTDIFLTSQLAQYQRGGGLYALPAYSHVLTVVINEGLFDNLGLTYPSPDWTYLDFRQLAEAATGTSGQTGLRRYGASLMAWPTAMPDAFYFHGFGGSYIDPGDRRRCALDAPGSVACGEFLFPLILDGVATTNWGPQGFAQGLAGISANWALPIVNVELFNNLKWNYYPQPRWPNGPATFVNSDFLAISAATKVADAAWEVLRYVAVEPELQRGVMKLTGQSPSLRSLIAEWTTVLRTVAPPLRTKNLEVYQELILTDRAFPGLDFAYSDAQAKTVIGSWAQQILARRISIGPGLRSAAAQVNALEANAAQSAPESLSELMQAQRTADARMEQMFTSAH